MKQIGILALQGAFAKHYQLLKKLNANPQLIKTKEMLNRCDGLIIPGGESTTMSTLMQRAGLLQPLKEFAKTRPLFGTCAGLILLAKTVKDSKMETLEVMDIIVERNGYGRQIDSFTEDVIFRGKKRPAHFIRAPKIVDYTQDVKVLATFKETPILVQQGHLMAASFHPELVDVPDVHEDFLQLVQ